MPQVHKPCPQFLRSPSRHSTLQASERTQATLQVPWQRTLQFFALVQIATEPSPRSPAQVPELMQLKSLLAPVSTLQTPVAVLQRARQLSPQRAAQLSAERHRNTQSSPVHSASHAPWVDSQVG